MRPTRAMLLLGLILISIRVASAQSTPGTPPFQTFARGPVDTINLGTANVHLEIPLYHKPGRGLPVDLTITFDNTEWLYDPSVWNGWYPSNAPSNSSQWYMSFLGSLSGTAVLGSPCAYDMYGNPISYSVYYYVVYVDASGTPHQMPNPLTETGGLCGNYVTGSTGFALDSSGYSAVGTGSAIVVYAKDGTQVSGPAGSQGLQTITDTNGNQISSSSPQVLNPGTSNVTVTDTLGRTAFSQSGLGSPSSPTTVQYTDPNGQTAHYTIQFVQAPLKTNFGCSGIPEWSGGGTLISEIDRPDGTKYLFNYEQTPGYPGYTTGRLASVTLPTGGTISYTYSGGNNGINCTDGSTATLTRTTIDGATTYAHSAPANSSTSTTTVSDPLGNQTVVTFLKLAGGNSSSQPNGYEIQRRVYQGSSGSGALLQTVYTCYNGAPLPCTTGSDKFPAVGQRAIFTQWANSEESELNTTYDTLNFYGAGYFNKGLVVEKDTYDYGNGVPGPLLRKTTTTYASLGNNILDRPSQVSVYDGSNNLKAQTTYAFDEWSLVTSGITTQHVSVSGSRGNPTSLRRWLSGSTTATTNCNISVSNGNLVSYSVYQDTGTVDHTVDSCGQSASDTGHRTSYQYSSTYAGAYPTTITNPLGQSVVNTYDVNTGLLTSMKDPNLRTTTYAYDSLLRTTQITYPDTGQTTYSYPNPNEEDVTQKIDSTHNKTGSEKVDGLGRVIQEIVSNGETSPYDQVDTCYDADGRVGFKSYPYQGTGLSGSPCPSSKPGDSFGYDALNRTSSLTHSDGTSVLTSYTDANGHTGRATSVQDEGNGTQRVQRLSQVDGLGRLTSICEVTSTTLSVGITGSTTPAACGQDITATGFLTTYAYDALDNLTSVTQGPLTARIFAYDSLSGLTSATNPESGQTTYTYDANGNVLTKRDARGITTCFGVWSGSTCGGSVTYDALNRLLEKSYSDGTPTVTDAYDQTSALGVALTNTVGRKSSESTAGSNPTGAVFSYDPVGRVLNNSQCTPQNCSGTPFSLAYTYDLLGDVRTSTNGSGVTFTNAYNVGARLTTLASSLSDSNHPGTLFSVGHFNAAGSLTSVTLGNNVAESRTYDGRLRLCAIQDGSVYSLAIPSTPAPCPTGAGGYAPNSDILAANDSVNGNWTYAYDPFNRLCAANQSSTQPVCGQTALYTYAYDRFGNRWQQNGPNSSQLGFDANNRIVSGSGVAYDAAGDTTNDGVTTYTYDAEDRITTAVNSSNGTSTYLYDAEGRRVRKTTVAGGTVDFLYDLAGHEISQITSAGSWTRGEVYAGGRHLATYSGGTGSPTYFIHADWLGTERGRSTVAGALCETITSLPFGDGMAISSTCSDPSPMHFTGKERDPETASTSGGTNGLDNFGARYDASSLGRFMSPDPDNAGAAEGAPQTWNAYSYVANDPLDATDPSGLDCIYLNATGTAAWVIRGDCVSDKDRGYYVDGTVDTSKAAQWNTSDHTLTVSLSSGQDTKFHFAPQIEALGHEPVFDNVLFLASGGIAAFFRTGASVAGSLFGTAAKTGAEAAAEMGGRVAAEQIVAAGAKGTVKQIIEDSALNDAQKAAVKQVLTHARGGQDIIVEKLADGTVRVTRVTLGATGGRAEYVTDIALDGTRATMQYGLNAAGDLMHVHQY